MHSCAELSRPLLPLPAAGGRSGVVYPGFNISCPLLNANVVIYDMFENCPKTKARFPLRKSLTEHKALAWGVQYFCACLFIGETRAVAVEFESDESSMNAVAVGCTPQGQRRR